MPKKVFTKKERIETLISNIREVHRQCCDLMEDGTVPEYSIDICSLDEVRNSLEAQLTNV